MDIVLELVEKGVTVFGGVLRECVKGSNIGEYFAKGGDIDIIVDRNFDVSIFTEFKICYGYDELKRALRKKFNSSPENVLPFCHYKGKYRGVDVDVVMICRRDFVHNCDFTCNSLIMDKNGLRTRCDTDLKAVKNDIVNKIIRIMPFTKYSNLHKMLCRMLIKLSEGYTVVQGDNLIKLIRDGITYSNSLYSLDNKHAYYVDYLDSMPQILFKLIIAHFDKICDRSNSRYIIKMFIKYNYTHHTVIEHNKTICCIFPLKQLPEECVVKYLQMRTPPQKVCFDLLLESIRHDAKHITNYLLRNLVDAFNKFSNDKKVKWIPIWAFYEDKIVPKLVEYGFDLPILDGDFSCCPFPVVELLYNLKKIDKNNLRQIIFTDKFVYKKKYLYFVKRFKSYSKIINTINSYLVNPFRNFCDRNNISYSIDGDKILWDKKYVSENKELYDLYFYKTTTPTIDQINYTIRINFTRHIKFSPYSMQFRYYSCTKYVRDMIKKYKLHIFPAYFKEINKFCEKSYYYYSYYLSRLSLPLDIINYIFKLL